MEQRFAVGKKAVKELFLSLADKANQQYCEKLFENFVNIAESKSKDCLLIMQIKMQGKYRPVLEWLIEAVVNVDEDHEVIHRLRVPAHFNGEMMPPVLSKVDHIVYKPKEKKDVVLEKTVSTG